MPEISLWEALAGRAPGKPVGPADPDLWQQVVERLNPAKARPVLRDGIEEARLTSLRGQPYVMMRSPGGAPGYLRVTAEEIVLAHQMDGSRTVARLVGEFAKITGRLAPEQVTRLVADLAGNRMLAELAVDAFRPLERTRRRPWPLRIGRAIAGAATGKRLLLGDADRLAHVLYRFGGRLLFTRAAAALMILAAVGGFGVFAVTWMSGARHAFATSGSYALGGVILLGLNVLGLLSHELGHALAAKHAGRRVPAVGLLFYFGIPSVFVDTSDVWMAGRRARILTSAAGPAAVLAFAGTANLVGLAVPGFQPIAFKLSLVWYLNALFNLNPLMALDGYYLLMDWLEIPNLRARGIATFLGRARRRAFGWRGLDGEQRLVAMYGTAAALWMIIGVALAVRVWKDRARGLVAGIWYAGWPSRVGLFLIVFLLSSPVVYLIGGIAHRRWRRAADRRRERSLAADEPRRLDALRRSRLGGLPPPALAALAREARWVRPRSGEQLVPSGASVPGVFVVVEGRLDGTRPGDPTGALRARAGAGDVAGVAQALIGAASSLTWTAVEALTLLVPREAFVRALGSLPGQVVADRADAEAVLDVPAFDGLADEDRLALLREMRPIDVEPGSMVRIEEPERVAVVASGVIVGDDGSEFRSGMLLGLPGSGSPPKATARSVARLWSLPIAPGLALLLGIRGGEPRARPNQGGPPPPLTGPHGGGGYPPLDAPPGVPSPDDGEADRRIARRFVRLLMLGFILALLLTWLAWLPAIGWGELPDERALLEVRRGFVRVIVDGRAHSLEEGSRILVGREDPVSVGTRSFAALVFAGGAEVGLCSDTEATLDEVRRIEEPPWRPLGSARIRPVASLRIERGRIVAETASRGAAFEPIFLDVIAGNHRIANDGEATFAASRGSVAVERGVVTADGRRLPATEEVAGCGSGGGLALDQAPGPVATPTPLLTATPTTAASPTPSSGPKATPTLTTEPTPTPTPTPTPGFSVACAPSLLHVSPGGAASSQCTVESFDGFDDPVIFSCSELRPGLTCTFNPPSVSVPPNGTASTTLTLTASSTARSDRVFYVVAAGAGITHRFTMQVIVS